MRQSNPQFAEALPLSLILLLGSLTLMFYTTELAPSGLMQQMSGAFHTPVSQVAWLVAVYTLPSALLAIPLTRLLARVNRRRLLLTLIASLGSLNVLIALAPNFYLVLLARLFSGVCAAIFWPMIAPYTLAIAPPLRGGKAIALVMTGSSLGLSLGVPLTTALGRLTSWRVTFLLIGVIYLTITALGWHYFPDVKGSQAGQVPHPKKLLHLPGISLGLAMVVLFVMAQYSTYVYIQMIAERVQFNQTLFQLLFGIGAISAILFVQRVIDEHLQQLLRVTAAFGILAMGLLLTLSAHPLVMIAAGIVWGMSFGPLSTLFQTTFTRQVATHREVAVSLESSTFDISILITTVLAGFCFDQWGITSNLILAAVAFSSVFALLYLYRQVI